MEKLPAPSSTGYHQVFLKKGIWFKGIKDTECNGKIIRKHPTEYPFDHLIQNLLQKIKRVGKDEEKKIRG